MFENQTADDKPRKKINAYGPEPVKEEISTEAQEARAKIKAWYEENKAALNPIPPLPPMIIVERIMKLFV